MCRKLLTFRTCPAAPCLCTHPLCGVTTEMDKLVQQLGGQQVMAAICLWPAPFLRMRSLGWPQEAIMNCMYLACTRCRQCFCYELRCHELCLLYYRPAGCCCLPLLSQCIIETALAFVFLFVACTIDIGRMHMYRICVSIGLQTGTGAAQAT